MVSHAPHDRKPVGLQPGLSLHDERDDAADRFPPSMEDSQITTTFDGVCGTKSVEVTRAGVQGERRGSDKQDPRPVIRQREIGYVAEPMC